MFSRRGSGLLLGLAMVLGAPALADAQLFPDLPIRRKRPDCSQENPQYKVIRQEYWGYYPTCWKKFPAGWGCPSPEAPNWEAEKKRLPLSPLSPLGSDGRGRDDSDSPPDNEGDMPAARPNARPNDPTLPPVPNDPSSPFNIIPEKPPTGADPRPGMPANRETPPAVDPPKPPAASAPGPVGDVPPITSTQPRRRGSLIAGLFAGRKP